MNGNASAPTGSKIYSLHVAVDNLSRDYPHHNELRLTSCANDAEHMAEMARVMGVKEPQILVDHEATVEGLKAAFMDIAAIAREDDIVFFTYAGHGAWIRDITKTENGRFDERTTGLLHLWFHPTVLLFDRMMMDDEWRVIWRAFRPLVRVVTMFDSCVSGTVDIAHMQPLCVDGDHNDFRGLCRQALAILGNRVADVAQLTPLKNFATFLRGNAATPAPSPALHGVPHARTPGAAIVADITAVNEPLYTKLQLRFADAELYAIIGLHLSACNDAEVANEGNGDGFFTKAVYDNFPNAKTYRDLCDKVTAALKSVNQNPQLIPFGVVPPDVFDQPLFNRVPDGEPPAPPSPPTNGQRAQVAQ